MTHERRSSVLAWCAFLAWFLVILVLVPWANEVRGGVNEVFGEQGVRVLAIVGATCLGFGGVLFARRRRRDEDSSKPLGPRLLWGGAILGAVLAWMITADIAAEPAHVVEYSILSVLAWYALSRKIRDASVYVSAALLTSIAGTIDEAVQWLTPGRYWDASDLVLNAMIAILAQLFLAQAIRPASIKREISPSGVRTAFRLAVVLVMLAALSLANTPERIYAYHLDVPGLAEHGREASTRMADYGHEFVDPEIGRWRSRLTLDELAQTDQKRGAEAAEIVARFAHPSRFGEFRRNHPPGRDAFVFEARAHLFHRDRYRNSIRHAEDEAMKRLRATRAWRENLILERYFPNVLSGARLQLKPGERNRLAQLHDPSIEFDSPVGKPAMITAFRERTMWIVALLLLVSLVFCERFAARRAAAEARLLDT